MVFSTIKIIPAPKQGPQVLEILRSVQDLTRPVHGCLGCYLSEQDLRDEPIQFVEQWESEEALHAHLRSDLYRRVLAALELSHHAPEIRFYYAVAERGFELIERVRGRATVENLSDQADETKV